MTNKKIKELALKAEKEGNRDLAIVLYTYLGSRHVSMGSDFARYCQNYAKKSIKHLDMYRNRRNN